MSLFNAPKPTLPAAARKAGATEIHRAGERTFHVGFKLTDGGLSEPGRGPAVLAALQQWSKDRAYAVSWAGQQCNPVVVTYTGGFRR